MELKAPLAGFLGDLALVPMLSPIAARQWGADYGQHPVGTGAFRLKEWVAQDHLTLERNPDYAWPPTGGTNPGPAYLDSATVKFIVDPPARVASLEAGDSQMAIFVPFQDVARLASEQRFTLMKSATQGMPLTFFMNVSAGPLASEEVRAAIEHALDREELVSIGGNGQPIPAQGLLSSNTRCYSTDFGDLFPHDLDGARHLLDGSGWVTGSDGLRYKDGAPLAFELVYFPDYASLATVIQAELHAVGIQLRLRMLDVTAGTALMRTGQTGAILRAGAGDATLLGTLFHSRVTGTSAVSAAIVQDPLSDNLLDRAAQEADPARQCDLYHQFEQRYLGAAAAFPIWELTTPVAVRSEVKGARLTPPAGTVPMLQEVYLAR